MAVVTKISAGLLPFRRRAELEVLLVHPGGPFFRNKDLGAWGIAKGEPHADEPLLDAAIREFGEELGLEPTLPLLPLGNVRQKGGKVVHAWAFEGDVPDDFAPRCNTFSLQWPPRSGRMQEFPEIDQAVFFPLALALQKMNPAQLLFLDRLLALLAADQPPQG